MTLGFEDDDNMKRTLSLFLALVMAFTVCACDYQKADALPEAGDAPVQADEKTEPEKTAQDTSGLPHFDKITLEFIPSRDKSTILSRTEDLPELVKAEMAKLGYDIDEVVISVGDSYEATGEAMSEGAADIGWLPGGTYARYSDNTEVILTATRNGLSNDSTNPADWNGEANKTLKNGSESIFYRALILAGPSKYGRELAEKVNAGETLTWEDLDKATWAVQNTTSSAGYIYPTMWLMSNYDGKKISDLSNVISVSTGYDTVFAYAAAELVDVIVCYADGRNDYEDVWVLSDDCTKENGMWGMGREDSIWNELNVIGVTEGIYNDTIAVSKKSQYYSPEMIYFLRKCFIDIISTDKGKEIFGVYDHTGYAEATDDDYDGARRALTLSAG